MTVALMSFALFDRHDEFIVRHGRLPHWYQPGVTYFVTFRTADSIPRALQRSWHGRRSEWLKLHGFDPTTGVWRNRLRQDPALEREFYKLFVPQFMAYLDRGYGNYVLRNRELAHVTAEALRHFDGDRYYLGDFVIMPNHVHLLVCLIGDTQIERQCRSWKRRTAFTINRTLRRHGRFWQSESFDHLVRSPEQFDYLRHYIADNPRRARLPRGNYLLSLHERR
ncbi:MAG: transposase [Pirellulales bacterium]